MESMDDVSVDMEWDSEEPVLRTERDQNPSPDDVEPVEDEEAEDEDESDSEPFDSDRIDAMLEELDGIDGTGDQKRSKPPAISMKDKYILIESNTELFEFLPPGWLKVMHQSGMPVYCHRETRICTFGRPYGLGRATLRNHKVPISAIPCLQYRNAKITPSVSSSVAEIPSHSRPEPTEPNLVCPHSSTFTSNTPDPNAVQMLCDMLSPSTVKADAPADSGSLAKTCVVTAKEHLENSLLSAEEIREYCSKLFQFRCKTVRRYRNWKVGRGRQRLIKRLKIESGATSEASGSKGTLIRSKNEENGTEETDDANAEIPATMLKNAKVMTITRPGLDGKAAVSFILNPSNKAPVSILHEYVQHTEKLQPDYVFLEMPDSNTPYQAVVRVNGREEGRGLGASKKMAKTAAAMEALMKLAPELRNIVQGGNIGEDDENIFRDITIDDPRVPEISYKAGLPAPYQILSTALRRLNAHQPEQIKMESKRQSHLKNEYTMTAGSHTASVICQKRDAARHLCAQHILKKMHPELRYYGELLKLYGMQYHRQVQERRDVQRAITDLQTKGKWGEPNWELLSKLKQEMRKVIPVPLQPGESSRIRYD